MVVIVTKHGHELFRCHDVFAFREGVELVELGGRGNGFGFADAPADFDLVEVGV